MHYTSIIPLHTSITSVLYQKGWRGFGQSKRITVKICVTGVTIYYLKYTQVLDLNWSSHLLFPKRTYSQGREIPGQLTLALKAGAILCKPENSKLDMFSLWSSFMISVYHRVALFVLCKKKKKACWRFVYSSDINVEICLSKAINIWEWINSVKIVASFDGHLCLLLHKVVINMSIGFIKYLEIIPATIKHVTSCERRP